MTYLPNHIFKNILSYCDDRIERQQKQRISNLNKTIVNLNNSQNFMIEVSNSNLSQEEKEIIIDDILFEIEKDFIIYLDRTSTGYPPFYNDDSFNYPAVFYPDHR